MNLKQLRERLQHYADTLSTSLRIVDGFSNDQAIDETSIGVRGTANFQKVEIHRLRHAAEGSGSALDVVNFEEAYQKTSGILAHIDALHRRDKVLRQLGEDPIHAPAWAYRVDRLTLAVLTTLGIDPTSAFLGHSGWRQTENGYTRPLSHPRLANSFTLRDGSDCHLKLSIHTDSAHEIQKGTWWYDDAVMTHPRIDIVSDAALPETLLDAAQGQGLSKIISLGAEADFPIRSMDSSRNNKTLYYYITASVERCMVPLAAAPDGVDTSWITAAGRY